ncbi:oligosaccharide flippase family protein [Allofrancisella frigidaquae]|uniref:Polysaccharide biosynthesis protein n=1 Tax=Allofrancisella frigidaquae TaxID=1085644 RepID=A0A6M3HUH9_9GAMM|nr:oligosaccharide flippase family protein [Allofrancisella frigidaquae]QIV94849.1 polysaccharide biosynthesis protein [Allofrancisella frigidaquae]
MDTSTSQHRSKNYILQVKKSTIFKILAIIISFLLVPIMIWYLGVEKYGIWSTIVSIFSWVVLFDVGIGSGLRNNLSKSLAKGKKNDAKKYVSTSYICIGVIVLCLLIIFFILSYYINWQVVFNTKTISENQLYLVVSVSGFFLIINFGLSLINQILYGLQKSSMVVFNQFLSNFFALSILGFIYFLIERSLFKLAFCYGFSLILSNVILTYITFKKYKFLIPKLGFFSKECIKSIASMGFKFFIIQIAVIVIFTTDKIMITQLFGPEYVTSYDVVFKLFSIIMIIHSLLITPLWSACSDAYHRGDIEWIKNSLFRQLQIFMLIIFGIIVLAFIAKNIISFWIGKDFIVDNNLIYAMSIFIIVCVWNNIFAFIVNGMAKLGIQTLTSIAAMLFNIPLSLILVKCYSFGVDGIIYGATTSLLLFSFLGSIQVYYLVIKKRK